MLIGELSRRAELTPRTVRHYESLGLIRTLEREGNSFHRYSAETLERLNKITALKQLGLNLSEIGAVLDLYFTELSDIQSKRAMQSVLEQHLQQTNARIGELTAFRTELESHIQQFREWLSAQES